MTRLRAGMTIAPTNLVERVELTESETSPKWQKLFPLGVTKFRADFGKIEFTRDMLSEMVRNYQAEGSPERAVNYFHLGASAVVAPLDVKMAAGWIQDLELRNDGLYALIKWTERARKYILADEIRYLSPEFKTESVNKNTGKKQGAQLLGAALLSDPFLTELPRVAASETPQGTAMEELKKLLKLAAEATEADVVKAVEALQAKDVQLSESSTKLAEVQGIVTKLQEQVGTLQAEKLELVKARDEMLAQKRADEVKAFVATLVKSGKIAPAIAEDVTKMGNANGLEAIKFFEKAEIKAVDMSEKGITGDPAASDPKADAIKRVQTRMNELETKGMKFAEAFKAVKAELPKDFELAYAAQ